MRRWSVPLDHDCVAMAVEIGCEHGLRTLDAIHLAAAARAPGLASVMTFDQRMIGAATAMGMRVTPGHPSSSEALPKTAAAEAAEA